FVDDLIDACAESSHISERQHGAGDLAIAFFKRGYPHNEPPVPVAKIGPGFHSACDDLAALLFQTGQASENRGIAGRPANVGRRAGSAARGRTGRSAGGDVWQRGSLKGGGERESSRLSRRRASSGPTVSRSASSTARSSRV